MIAKQLEELLRTWLLDVLYVKPPDSKAEGLLPDLLECAQAQLRELASPGSWDGSSLESAVKEFAGKLEAAAAESLATRLLLPMAEAVADGEATVGEGLDRFVAALPPSLAKRMLEPKLGVKKLSEKLADLLDQVGDEWTSNALTNRHHHVVADPLSSSIDCSRGIFSARVTVRAQLD